MAQLMNRVAGNAAFVGGQLRVASCVNMRLPARYTVARAENDKKPVVLQSVEDEYVNEFCNIDETGKRAKKKTLGEMEAEFIDAMREYYFEGKSVMSNEEFDLLKEELTWEGSKVVVLSADELRLIEATQSFSAGKPVLSDEEYTSLKSRLRDAGSTVALDGPRCSLRSKKVYADAAIDYQKMLALNLPAVLVVLGLVYVTDFATGFSISRIIETPNWAGFLALWSFLLPGIYVTSSGITNLVLRDGVILKTQCPSCGNTCNAYFGDIFIIEGGKGEVELECGNCSSMLKWNNAKRQVEMTREGPAVKA